MISVVFGLTAQAALRYLGDHVDTDRLPANPPPFGANWNMFGRTSALWKIPNLLSTSDSAFHKRPI